VRSSPWQGKQRPGRALGRVREGLPGIPRAAGLQRFFRHQLRYLPQPQFSTLNHRLRHLVNVPIHAIDDIDFGHVTSPRVSSAIASSHMPGAVVWDGKVPKYLARDILREGRCDTAPLPSPRVGSGSSPGVRWTRRGRSGAMRGPTALCGLASIACEAMIVRWWKLHAAERQGREDVRADSSSPKFEACR